MFYSKNLPVWERALRVFAGAFMLACGLIGLQGLWIGLLVTGVGVVTALTGFFGFCPMCAMVSRKLMPSLKR